MMSVLSPATSPAPMLSAQSTTPVLVVMPGPSLATSPAPSLSLPSRMPVMMAGPSLPSRTPVLLGTRRSSTPPWVVMPRRSVDQDFLLKSLEETLEKHRYGG